MSATWLRSSKVYYNYILVRYSTIPDFLQEVCNSALHLQTEKWTDNTLRSHIVLFFLSENRHSACIFKFWVSRNTELKRHLNTDFIEWHYFCTQNWRNVVLMVTITLYAHLVVTLITLTNPQNTCFNSTRRNNFGFNLFWEKKALCIMDISSKMPAIFLKWCLLQFWMVL